MIQLNHDMNSRSDLLSYRLTCEVTSVILIIVQMWRTASKIYSTAFFILSSFRLSCQKLTSLRISTIGVPVQILNHLRFQTLLVCWTNKFTSLIGHIYAVNVWNRWRFNFCSPLSPNMAILGIMAVAISILYTVNFPETTFVYFRRRTLSLKWPRTFPGGQ